MQTKQIFGRAAAVSLTILLTLAGFWGVRRLRASAATPAPPGRSASLVTMPDATLTVISTPTRASASDREIEKWAALAKQKPNEPNGWVRLGDSYMQKARETADSGYYSLAQGCYEKALVINPKRTEALIGLAWVNGGRHEFEKSIEFANKALAIDPANNEACGLIGDAAVEMGNYDEAFAQYQKMLDIHPDLASYSRGAHAVQLGGDTRKALFLIDKAIKSGGPFSENTAWCKAEEAKIMLNIGGYKPAEQLVKDALKKSPNNFHLLLTQAKAESAMKKYDAAIESYKKAIAIAPQIEAVVALGDVYSAVGKPEEAKKQYALVEEISKLNSVNGVKGEMQIAQFYADHDMKLPEALKIAEEEYRTRKSVYAADTLAWCYYKNNRLPEAKKMSDVAVSRKTPEALFLYHQGMIASKSGDISTAKQKLYEAVSLSSNFHPISARTAEAEIHRLGETSQTN